MKTDKPTPKTLEEAIYDAVFEYLDNRDQDEIFTDFAVMEKEMAARIRDFLSQGMSVAYLKDGLTKDEALDLLKHKWGFKS